jgi:hypothetical protein
MDEMLHGERLANRTKQLHALHDPISTLPDGTMIAANDQPCLIARGDALRWTPDGYKAIGQPITAAMLITPPSTINALRAGYRPVLHSTARDS